MDKEHGIATGYAIYPSLSDGDKALVAFGMTNVTTIERVERENAEFLATLSRDEKREFMKGVTLGLMKAAKAVGKMVV
jgi:hypothetical protein